MDDEAPLLEGDEVIVGGRRLEVAGIVLFICALLVCFAVFSFEPGDSGQGNLVGPLGVHLARGVLGTIGVVGYLAALALTVVAGAVIIGRIARPSPVVIAGSLASVLALSVLSDLLFRGQAVVGHPAGGIVGREMGRFLSSGAGVAGAGLIAVGVLLVSVIAVFDVSVGAAMRDALSLGSLLRRRAMGGYEAFRLAREAAKEREAELIELERARRVQAKAEQEAREKRMADELEEKKRLAVLRATAKAEERALSKIAALEAKERLEREAREAKARAELETPPEIFGAAEEAAAARALEDAQAFSGAGEGDVAASVEPQAPPARGARARGAKAAETSRVELVSAADVLEGLVAAPAPAPAIVERRTSEAEVFDDDAELEAEDDAFEDGDADPGGDDEDEGLEDGEIRVYERKHVEAAVLDEEGEAELVDEPVSMAPERRDLAPVEEKAERRVYQMPGVSLLDYEGKPPAPVDGEALRARATRLEEKLRTYGVEGRVTAIRPGPVVTTYEYQPAPGVKVSKIAGLSDDIAMSMEAMRVRIVAPIPGRGVVGIELPNQTRESVYLKEIIAHDSFKRSKSMLTLALGKDAEGEPQVRDLRSMPHILVAGTTGSGKSVSINTMILSILYKATPDQVKFIMVDPKMLELSLYEDIPHLLLPVVTDPRKASRALQWAVDEMERRYQLLSEFKVRDLDGFNRRIERLREQRRLMKARADLELAELREEADAERELGSDFGTAADADFGTAADADFGTAADADFGTAADADFGTELDSGFGTGVDSQRLGAGALPFGLEAGESGRPTLAPTSTPPTSTPRETALAPVELLDPDALKADEKRLFDPWPSKELPDTLPYIVVLIDEFADLMCVAPRDVESSVQRLAQKARAAGIHVMLATQRPSTDVITGVIKNNFPSRISFRVASRHDSATILNAPGAENLLGMGDMLCLGVTSPAPVRIHGAFVTEEEVQRVVDFWKAQAKPSYDASILKKRDDDEEGAGEEVEHDEMYDKAVAIVTETRKASISAIQRRLRVGYNRAARMIEMMETEGLVGPAIGPKGEREVLVRAIGPEG